MCTFGSVWVWVCLCVSFEVLYCAFLPWCVHLGLSGSVSVCVFPLRVLYCAFLPWCVHLGLSGSGSVCVFPLRYCTVLSCPGVCIWVCLGLGLCVYALRVLYAFS